MKKLNLYTITAALLLVAFIALPAIVQASPYVYRIHFQGTNTMQVALSKTAKAFTPSKIVVVDAVAEDGTVVVQRFRAPVTEPIATVTNTSGSVTAKVSESPVVYPLDRLLISGSVTNAFIEIHGTIAD